MILAVFGPRDAKTGAEGRIAAASPKTPRKHYNNYEYIADALSEYSATHIITGGGYGVEQLALRYAVSSDIEHTVIPPNLAQYGHNAFNVRNSEILSAAELVILFWDGRDKFYHGLMSQAVEHKTILHLRHVE